MNQSVVEFHCPHCGDTDCKPGDKFCGACGKSLPPPVALSPGPELCPACGAAEFDEDGFCKQCGTRRRGSRGQPDDMEAGAGLAAVTDVGLKHVRNDDAFAVSGPGTGGAGSVVVVCDGVSNSQSPDVGSVAGAKAARLRLEKGMSDGEDPKAAMHAAIAEAHEAVCAVPFDRQAQLDPPAVTIVAATIAPGTQPGMLAVTMGWLGDSRIYLLSPQGGRLLTRDHSWRNLVVDQGEMTDDEARRDPRAHMIVDCLGSTDFAKATPCPTPSVETVEVPADGSWLVSCTDGLWNYAESAQQVASAANGSLWTGSAIDGCRRLVAFAKARGGHDNITVAMARLG
jgi:serine/threonine protein phosphatase PrpC